MPSSIRNTTEIHGRLISRERFTQTRRLAVLASIVATTFIHGCGKAEKTIPQLPVVPVTGKITIDGQTPVGAQVVLNAGGAAGPTGVTAKGTVKQDGTFQISTYSADDGAPAGEYVVTLQWFKIDSDGAAGPNVIPKQYTERSTSPIKVTVGSGPTTLEPIAIASR